MSFRLTTIRGWLNSTLHFLFPETCQHCRSVRATAAQGFICADCWRQVRFIRPPFCERCGLPFEGDLTTQFECSNCREMDLHFTSARSAVIAKGLTLDIIHRYKYNQALWFEPFLADLLIREAKPELSSSDWHLIVPVPLHPLKLRERGFNQALQLGTLLGRASQIPVEDRLLSRVLPTRTQTLLSRAERTANVKNAFSVTKGCKLNGARIVVVDDVFTTGATTNACARALQVAGAERVCVWTLARGL